MINATSDTTSLQSTTETAYENPDGILGKDDFMMLLLAELQYQDPTEPTDTETILTQTSQLAALESADNTNKALEDLAASLGNSDQMATVAAIGKTADLGSNAITYTEGSTSNFEVYFPSDVEAGTVEVLNADGEVIQTLEVEAGTAGVQQFTWDGTDGTGNFADSGYYYVTSSYTDTAGNAQETRLGTYPIESVRFEGTDTLVKVGSSYVSLDQIVEIY